MIAAAPMCVVICGDKSIQETEEFLIEDCAAAAENILLAAHGIGLGAVWCGVLKRSSLAHVLTNVLALPDTIVPLQFYQLDSLTRHRRLLIDTIHRKST